MKKHFGNLFFVFFFIPGVALADENLFEMSLQEILKLDIVTSASTYEQPAREAHANVIVVSKQQIARRGYQTLIDVLEDVPGFEFSTYGDSGEYPTNSSNRGMGGDPGNTKLIIMVDGVVQNHIAFNWSYGWGSEQMLFDLERIEIIQGPGSALYGANSFSGIINLITLKEYEGVSTQVRIGENSSRNIDLLWGKELSKGRLLFALRKYETVGDSGKERTDPADYFHNNVTPNSLTESYDDSGNYMSGAANPFAGEAIEDGFDTSVDSYVFRFKYNYKEFEIGSYYWDKKNGLGSYVPGYEYYANDDNRLYQFHHKAYHIYAQHNRDINDKATVFSRMVWRENKIMPDTGFAYTYRYPDLVKSYHSKSGQFTWEERLSYKLNEKSVWIFGARAQFSTKMDQQISLGDIQGDETYNGSSSCWSLRESGLNQSCKGLEEDVKEFAGYILWDGKFTEQLSHSFGFRYDNSDEYDAVLNPRISLAYSFYDWWSIRSAYSTAFRQPSLFELGDEFRGNSNLDPESVGTYELENKFLLIGGSSLKVNIFYSKLSDLIGEEDDPTSPSGRRFANLNGSKNVKGFSTTLYYPLSEWTSYSMNYIYTDKEANDFWGASHKANAGVNWQKKDDKLNINLRANWVGERNTPQSNSYFSGEDAPSFIKADLVIWFKEILGSEKVDAKLAINNIFDKQFYGVGRQSGFSDIDSLDVDSNPNPDGFIPAYHPQPGREFFASIGYHF